MEPCANNYKKPYDQPVGSNQREQFLPRLFNHHACQKQNREKKEDAQWKCPDHNRTTPSKSPPKKPHINSFS